MTNSVELRMKAYTYMVNNFKSKVLGWFPSIDSDKRLAATLTEELVVMAKKEDSRLSQIEIKAIQDIVKESLKKGSKSLLEAELNAIEDIAGSLESEIDSLKRGQSDPSQRLVAAFKQFFGQTINEDEVDSYLIAPFTSSL